MKMWLIYGDGLHSHCFNLMGNRRQSPIRAEKSCDEPHRTSLDRGGPSLDILSMPADFELSTEKEVLTKKNWLKLFPRWR